jgi:clan AA aspartic protease
MITGYVNSEREAVISIAVYGPQGEMREIEAVIDTGFSGDLTLPSAVVAALRLNVLANEHLTLADGSEVASEVCPAIVIWDGQPQIIEVSTLETDALVGMGLLEGHHLNIHVAVGGRVTIEPSSTAQPPSA